jgi:hypothetical protein
MSSAKGITILFFDDGGCLHSIHSPCGSFAPLPGEIVWLQPKATERPKTYRVTERVFSARDIGSGLGMPSMLYKIEIHVEACTPSAGAVE